MIPEISFTKFKGMTAKEIKECKSFSVNTDGELAFIVTVPQNGFIRQSVIEVCMLGNNAGGKDIKEAING